MILFTCFFYINNDFFRSSVTGVSSIITGYLTTGVLVFSTTFDIFAATVGVSGLMDGGALVSYVDGSLLTKVISTCNTKYEKK